MTCDGRTLIPAGSAEGNGLHSFTLQAQSTQLSIWGLCAAAAAPLSHLLVSVAFAVTMETFKGEVAWGRTGRNDSVQTFGTHGKTDVKITGRQF